MLKLIVGCLLLAVVEFFAGGFFARSFLIQDNQGFEGATTAALSAFVGAGLGVALGIVLLRR